MDKQRENQTRPATADETEEVEGHRFRAIEEPAEGEEPEVEGHRFR